MFTRFFLAYYTRTGERISIYSLTKNMHLYDIYEGVDMIQLLSLVKKIYRDGVKKRKI